MSSEALHKVPKPTHPLSSSSSSTSSPSFRLNKMQLHLLVCSFLLLSLILSALCSAAATQQTMHNSSSSIRVRSPSSSSTTLMQQQTYAQALGMGEGEEGPSSAGGGMRSISWGAPAKRKSSSSMNTMGEVYSDQMDTSMEQLKERDYNIQSFMLVHSGNMNVEVSQERFSDVSEEIDRIVQETGQGYFQDKQRGDTGSPREYLRLTIRVQSDTFHQVVDEIRKLADKVVSLSTNSRDVTDEFVDASARADALEATRASLQAIMSKADSVEDVLKLQKELTRLTEQAESHRQRAQQLKKQSVRMCGGNWPCERDKTMPNTHPFAGIALVYIRIIAH